MDENSEEGKLDDPDDGNHTTNAKTKEILNKLEGLDCPNCGKRFSARQSVLRHIHHKICRLVKCKRCDECFEVENSNTPGQYLCPSCGEKKLIKKKKPHVLRYWCPECGRGFQGKRDCDNHTNNKLCKRQCDMCTCAFRNDEALEEHRQKQHNMFQCAICDKTFFHIETFKFHIRQHTASQTFKCEYCDVTFFDLANVKRHIRICHKFVVLDSKTAHTCQLCEFKFLNIFTFKNHLVVCHRRLIFEKLENTSDAVYHCDECDKTLTLLEYAPHKQYHLMLAKSASYKVQCKKCILCFPNPSLMYMHLSVHNTKVEDYAKSWQCGKCGFVSYDKDVLAEHCKNCTLDNVCLFCGKVFKSESKLRKHFKIHTAERPYFCRISFCHMAFKLRSLRLQHEVTFHKLLDEQDAKEGSALSRIYKQSEWVQESLGENGETERFYTCKLCIRLNKIYKERNAKKFVVHVGRCACKFLLERLSDTSKQYTLTQGIIKLQNEVAKEYASNTFGFPCNTCGLKFEFKYGADWHKKLHEFVKLDEDVSTTFVANTPIFKLNFHCPICEFKGSRANETANHIREIHKRNVPVTVDAVDYSRTTDKFTGPPPQYGCCICNLLFSSKVYASMHIQNCVLENEVLDVEKVVKLSVAVERMK